MPFSPRVVVWLTGIATVTFLFGILLGVYSERTVTSTGADTYSRSALGHHALVRVLEELEVPVVRSTFDSAHRARDGLLVLAEPQVSEDSRRAELFEDLVYDIPPVLIVLPRRRGVPDSRRPGWIEFDAQRSAAEIAAWIEPIIGGSRIERAPAREWHAPGFVSVPTLRTPQLLAESELIPLISCAEGVLLGKVPDVEIYVLADPDLFATHGLREHGALALEIIERLRPPGGPVVFDETLHGYAAVRGLWGELFRFPLVLLVMHVVLACAVLVLAASWRFGAPRTPADEAGLAAGHAGLLDSTARLLAVAGHAAYSVVRYHAAHVQDVVEHLHLTGDSAERHERLRMASRLRGVEPLFDAMERTLGELNPVRRGQPLLALRAARAIAHWRMEILREPGSDPAAR